MNKSLFITFEGGEGSGKTTQINFLSKYLKSKSFKVLVTREPGGSEGAESIRKLLVTGTPGRWDVETEALLMYAARRDNFIRTISPSLNDGKIVISDRFSDSTRVYQGLVGGVPEYKINTLHSFCLEEIEPDLTFLLDINYQDGLSRAKSRISNENRFESKGNKFHKSIRKAYLKLASENPNRIHVIDASKSKNQIKLNIFKIIDKHIEKIKNYNE